jgi:hypothetical protein
MSVLGSAAAIRLKMLERLVPGLTRIRRTLLHSPRNRLESLYSHFYAQPDLSET